MSGRDWDEWHPGERARAAAREDLLADYRLVLRALTGVEKDDAELDACAAAKARISVVLSGFTGDASCTEVVASLAQRTHAGGPLPRPLNREGENRAHLVAEIRNAIAPLMLDDGEDLEAGERRLCLARVVRACDALMALERA